MTASRLPRRTKAAAASTNRMVALVKDQIAANYNTIQLHFNRNDVDNSGKTDLQALLTIMECCKVPMTKAQAIEIIQLLDPDDQGRFEFPAVLKRCLECVLCENGKAVTAIALLGFFILPTT